ncbi:Alkaline phosphatase, tissue-nonspecific isozyme [Trachymyrmex septentrionalis]|uniref:alkaline phosphatase n=1 Tax=Trachymyrmex septentrionalis TaxID=34720 RepID=A0A195F6V2_9HYME|nr:Alkaline phosphatase, tissue-nonspecific isozyme [Trachymyrmex septentrionalis]
MTYGDVLFCNCTDPITSLARDIYRACLFAEREIWYETATRAIETRIREAASTSVSGTTLPTGIARGVVLFVGDGMGMSTLTAARILAGQRHGNPGEETQLAWESFPAVALARVSTRKRRSLFIFLLLFVFLENVARKTVALRASNLLR